MKNLFLLLSLLVPFSFCSLYASERNIGADCGGNVLYNYPNYNLLLRRLLKSLESQKYPYVVNMQEAGVIDQLAKQFANSQVSPEKMMCMAMHTLSDRHEALRLTTAALGLSTFYTVEALKTSIDSAKEKGVA